MHYVPTPEDVGKRLQINVTARNDAGVGDATSELTPVIRARPPENRAAPSISGRSHVGDELTAERGEWTGTETVRFAYQWLRCATSGACIEIAGATSRTSTAVADDANAVLRVRVTATNDVGAKAVQSAPTAAVAADAPRNTAAPAVTGPTRVGETLAVDDGSWAGTGPLTRTYQWQRCDASGASCEDVAGQTERMYVTTGADEGHTIRVVVATAGPGGSARAASPPSDVIDPASAQPNGDTPDTTVAPAISGTPRAGSTLSVERGHWTGTEPITYTYQWRRCDSSGANCVDIDGATALQYVATAADVGHTLRIVATGTNAIGSGTATSAPTAVVTASAAAGGNATPAPAQSPTPAQSSSSTPATGAATTPATGSGTAAADDLSVLPDSQISSSACAMLVGGGGFRRIDLPATGSGCASAPTRPFSCRARSS
jgi:hypothetical protein